MTSKENLLRRKRNTQNDVIEEFKSVKSISKIDLVECVQNCSKLVTKYSSDVPFPRCGLCLDYLNFSLDPNSKIATCETCLSFVHISCLSYYSEVTSWSNIKGSIKSVSLDSIPSNRYFPNMKFSITFKCEPCTFFSAKEGHFRQCIFCNKARGMFVSLVDSKTNPMWSHNICALIYSMSVNFIFPNLTNVKLIDEVSSIFKIRNKDVICSICNKQKKEIMYKVKKIIIMLVP